MIQAPPTVRSSFVCSKAQFSFCYSPHSLLSERKASVEPYHEPQAVRHQQQKLVCTPFRHTPCMHVPGMMSAGQGRSSPAMVINIHYISSQRGRSNAPPVAHHSRRLCNNLMYGCSTNLDEWNSCLNATEAACVRQV